MTNKVIIPTSLTTLKLKQLDGEDAKEYFNLVVKNREHLTHHGDYSEYKNPIFEEIGKKLNDAEDKNAKFGIWLNDSLIGRVDLSPRKVGDYVLGYWLDKGHLGNGYTTIACKALIGYGHNELKAKSIYAGVTKGNIKSEALLKRLDFKEIEDKGDFTLYFLNLGLNE